MAFLGDYGALSLQREQAQPGILLAVDLDMSSNRVLFLDGAYMTGDEVVLTLVGGLPFVGASDTETYWIHRDQLDRISFHRNPYDAINNSNPLIFVSDSWTDIEIQQSQPARKYVADIREWKLDMDAAAIDTTPIGVRFGENICDLITGSGDFRFLVELRNQEEIINAVDLLNLLFLTGPGGKAAAQFWLHTNKPGSGCGLLPGMFYYEANILIVRSSVQLRPDELVEGVVNFVTTEQAAFRVAPVT